MQDASKSLLEAVQTGSKSSIGISFANFCNAFRDEYLAEIKPSFIPKLFGKTACFDLGISTFTAIVDQPIFAQIDHLTLRQTLSDLFHVLIHPHISLSSHRTSFALLLRILSVLSRTADDTDFEVYSELLTYGCYLEHYTDPSKPVSFYTPISAKPDRNKTDEFTKELFDMLIKHAAGSYDLFVYFWRLMSASLLPTLFNMPSACLQIIENAGFPYPKLVQLIIQLIPDDSSTNSLEAFIDIAPDIFLRTVHGCMTMDGEEIAWQCIDRFTNSMHLLHGFLRIIETNGDFSSIAIYYEGILPNLGKTINPNNTLIRWRYNTNINTFQKFVTSCPKPEIIAQIIDQLARWIKNSQSTFSLYSLMQMIYMANVKMPQELAHQFSDLDGMMMSAACGFSSVLAVVFASQLLNVTEEQLHTIGSDKFFKDCGTFFLGLTRPTIVNRVLRQETEHLIASVLLEADKRDRTSALQFLDQFFVGWKSDTGIFKLYACFTQTIVSIAKMLPVTVPIDLGEVFADTIISFLAVADGPQPPEFVLMCVQLVVDIISLRDFALSLPPALSAKISLSVLRTMCYNDISVRNAAIELAAQVILTGNSIFFTIAPYYITILWQNSDICPSPSELSAILSIITFMQRCNCSTACSALESRVSQLLSGAPEKFFSPIAIAYFESQQRKLESAWSPGFELFDDDNDFATAAINLLCCLWKRHLQDDPEHRVEIFNALTIATLLMERPPDVLITSISDRSNIEKCPTGMMRPLSVISESISAIDSKVANTLAHNLSKRFFIDMDVNALFLAIDLFVSVGNNTGLTGLWKQLDEGRKQNPAYDDIIDLILIHFGQGQSRPPLVSTLENDLKYSASFSSPAVLHVIQQVGNDPVMVTSMTSRRSTFGFHAIRPDPAPPVEDTEEVVIPLSPDPSSAVKGEATTFFTNLLEQIKQHHMEYLLSTPEELASKKTDPKETSPISSYSSQFDSLGSLSNSALAESDELLCAMALLKLFGNNTHEYSTSEEQNLAINTILKGEWLEPVNVPVFYTTGETIDVKKSDTSELFSQFVHALGHETLENTYFTFRDWQNEFIFEVVPSRGSELATSKARPVRVIWHEGPNLSGIDFKHAAERNCTIWLRPLSNGFIRVRVETVGLKAWSGPLREVMLIPCEALPALVRSTVGSMYALISNCPSPYDKMKKVIPLMNQLATKFDTDL